jgi:hypothetical protein
MKKARKPQPSIAVLSTDTLTKVRGGTDSTQSKPATFTTTLYAPTVTLVLSKAGA